MKHTTILKPNDTWGKELQSVITDIKVAIVTGKNVVLEVDIGESCPKCGGVSVDGGDMWLKQYGRRHRTCIDCMHIWPEASA
jgi:hypothetical protein